MHASTVLLLASSLVSTVFSAPYYPSTNTTAVLYPTSSHPRTNTSIQSYPPRTSASLPYSSPTHSAGTPPPTKYPSSSGSPPAGSPPPSGAPPSSSPPASGLTLFQQLVLAPNAVERSKLLPDDKQYVFNFNDPQPTSPINPIASGLGGHTVRADHATFPALVGSGGSMVLGFLGPCGFNTPHVHPRAAEFNLVVQGRLGAQVVFESGARTMSHEYINKYEMTLFPQGAVHAEFNPDCTDAVFVAAFPNEDPGVGQIAQEFFGLRQDVVKASMGMSGGGTIDGKDLEDYRHLIPANVAMGVDACLEKCGIKKWNKENL